MKRLPELSQQIRVIHTSPPFGIPPVVVSPNLRPQTRAQLEAILLNMHKDVEGRTALQALDYDMFVNVQPEDYLTAEEIESQVILENTVP